MGECAIALRVGVHEPADPDTGHFGHEVRRPYPRPFCPAARRDESTFRVDAYDYGVGACQFDRFPHFAGRLDRRGAEYDAVDAGAE